jgi:hypothetical protein
MYDLTSEKSGIRVGNDGIDSIRTSGGPTMLKQGGNKEKYAGGCPC